MEENNTMQFVFWQNMISIHQSALIKALAREHGVLLAVQTDFEGGRESSGWTVPDMGNARILISPDARTVEETLRAHLEKMGYTVTDHGTYSKESCDYPVFAHALCNAVEAEDVPGILICGTGIGMSIAANRHMDNVAFFGLVLPLTFEGARITPWVMGGMIGPNMAERIVDVFLSTAFEGGRHQRRIDLLNA